MYFLKDHVGKGWKEKGRKGDTEKELMTIQMSMDPR